MAIFIFQKSMKLRQLFVNDFEKTDNHLIVKLGVEKTDCKAIDICGVPETVSMSDS